MFDLYRERKRLQLERLMAAYVKTDGAPVVSAPRARAGRAAGGFTPPASGTVRSQPAVPS